LRKIFPEYQEYAEHVPALLPKPPGIQSRQRFRLQLYLRNQEYQALAGYLAGFAYLLWRCW